MNETVAIVAACFAGISLLIVVAEKLWGGGNALAGKFHTLERETNAAIAVVRQELNNKIDEYEKVSTVGFDAVKANIHAMQLGLLEFRAKMAEELHLYIRKDDYNAGISDVKRDVQNGFKNVEERLGQMQDLIMYVNPDAPVRPQQHGKPR